MIIFRDLEGVGGGMTGGEGGMNTGSGAGDASGGFSLRTGSDNVS